MILTKLKTNNNRKASLLSVCFLIAINIFLISCKKAVNTIGESALDPELLLKSGGIDTFSLETFSVLDDSITTANSLSALLGRMNDPELGYTSASFYTQLRYQSLPTLTATNKVYIDSMVLALSYSDFYGVATEQEISVLELDEALSETKTYRRFSTIATKGNNLVKNGTEQFVPQPTKKVVIGKDTLSPQLRIALDTTFGRSFFNAIQTKNDLISTNEKMTAQFFKGLKLSVSPKTFSNGEGGISSFDLGDNDTKMTIYYHLDSANGPRFQFNFIINSNCTDFNNITIDNASKEMVKAINNKVEGSKSFFAQAFYTRACIAIPNLLKINKKSIVQEALLVLPVTHQFGQPFGPPAELSIAARQSETDKAYYSLGQIGLFDVTKSRYVLNVKNYVQAVLTAGAPNLGIYVAPRTFSASSQRVIFNGANTTNKQKPQLIVKYTEF